MSSDEYEPAARAVYKYVQRTPKTKITQDVIQDIIYQKVLEVEEVKECRRIKTEVMEMGGIMYGDDGDIEEGGT